MYDTPPANRRQSRSPKRTADPSTKLGYCGLPTVPLKSTKVAAVLALTLGLIGAHHFYLGKVERGCVYFLTLGFCGVGLIADLVSLRRQVRAANTVRVLGIR